MAHIYCPSCEALAINAVPCHERGCPQSSKPWEFRGRGTHRICKPAGVETPAWLLPESTVPCSEDLDDEDEQRAA